MSTRYTSVADKVKCWKEARSAVVADYRLRGDWGGVEMRMKNECIRIIQASIVQ